MNVDDVINQRYNLSARQKGILTSGESSVCVCVCGGGGGRTPFVGIHIFLFFLFNFHFQNRPPPTPMHNPALSVHPPPPWRRATSAPAHPFIASYISSPPQDITRNRRHWLQCPSQLCSSKTFILMVYLACRGSLVGKLYK